MVLAAAAGWGPSVAAFPGEGGADWNASMVREAFLSAPPALGVATAGVPQVLVRAVGFVEEPAAARGAIDESVAPGLADRVSYLVRGSSALAGGPALAGGWAGGVGALAPAPLARPPVAGSPAGVEAEVSCLDESLQLEAPGVDGDSGQHSGTTCDWDLLPIAGTVAPPGWGGVASPRGCGSPGKARHLSFCGPASGGPQELGCEPGPVTESYRPAAPGPLAGGARGRVLASTRVQVPCWTGAPAAKGAQVGAAVVLDATAAAEDGAGEVPGDLAEVGCCGEVPGDLAEAAPAACCVSSRLLARACGTAFSAASAAGAGAAGEGPSGGGLGRPGGTPEDPPKLRAPVYGFPREAKRGPEVRGASGGPPGEGLGPPGGLRDEGSPVCSFPREAKRGTLDAWSASSGAPVCSFPL